MRRRYRLEMRSRARSVKGLVNVLQSDADYVFRDVEDHDIISLGESLKELKNTVQDLVDNVAELEYALYLSSNGEGS